MAWHNKALEDLWIEIADLRKEIKNLKSGRSEFVYNRSDLDSTMNKTMPVQQAIEMILDHLGAEFIHEPESVKLAKKEER